MNGFALLVTAAVLGVDYGWQPDADDQLEYIIQIEPVTLIALREGQEIVSKLDPYVRNVRRFRIHVGTDMVPRRGTPPREPLADASAVAMLDGMPGVQFGWQFVDDRQMEFIVQIAPDRYASLRNGEDIVGRIPVDVQNLARIRILSGSNTLPRTGLPSAQPAGPAREPAPTNEPAPLIPAPALVTGPQTTNTPPAGPPLGSPGLAAGPRGVQVPSAYPPTTNTPPAVGTATGSMAHNSQLNSHYQWMADATNKTSNVGVSPSVRQPVTPYPGTGAPPTATSQPIPVMGDPARGVPAPSSADTININDNRGSAWQNLPPNAMVRVPNPLDTARQSQSGGVYSADRSAELSHFPTPAASPGRNEYSPSVPGSLGGSDRALGAESYATTADTYSLGVPDALASALGFEPWPNRVVSYEQDVEPIVDSEDFWSSLAATANDRSLDYLIGDTDSAESTKPGWPLTLAVFALFASIGGNLFMGWVTLDIYRRSLDLTDDAIDRDRYESPSDHDEQDTWSEKRGRHTRSRVGA